jgi:CBS domain containing-hemolysin-like protein
MPDVSQLLLGLLAILTLVLANGFFVAAEFALVTVRRTRIEQLIAEGSATARVVRRALGDPDSYIAATQLGITMTSLGLGWIGEPALAAVLEPAFSVLGDRVAVATSHSIAFTIAFAIITALHIVLGELAPKTVALQHPERTSLIVARPTELFMRVFWPFISLLNGMGRAVVHAFGLRGPSGHSLVHSEEELKMLVTASQEAGVLEEREEQMLHRVFDFADLTAGQVMVPRTELVAVPFDLAGDALLQAMGRAGYSTIPVYRENLDNIVGMLHAIDVVKALAGGQKNVNAGAVARETLNVPEAMGADDLLASLHQRGVREAVVIDEYGGTAGLVTFEWLMQRIVGAAGVGDSNIHPDGSADVDGLALVGDVNAQFGLHIDEETYTTLGGYVMGCIGRRARVGDTIDVEGRRLRVMALDGLRVARVWVSAPRGERRGPEPPR